MTEIKYRRKPGFSRKELGSDTMLYSQESEAVHILNATSAFIWESLERPHTAAELEGAIRSNFEIPEDADVRQDLEQVLAEFKEKGLVEAC
jgi:PqqD family protein of HPr-rel-A system